MDLIDIILLGVAVVFGYWRGVVSGYNTKVAESHVSKLVNIRAEKIGESYHFRDFESDLFLTQSPTLAAGVDSLHARFGADKTLLLSVVEPDSESV